MKLPAERLSYVPCVQRDGADTLQGHMYEEVEQRRPGDDDDQRD